MSERFFFLNSRHWLQYRIFSKTQQIRLEEFRTGRKLPMEHERKCFHLTRCFFLFGKAGGVHHQGLKCQSSCFGFSSLQELKHCKRLQDVLSNRYIELSQSIQGDRGKSGFPAERGQL